MATKIITLLILNAVLVHAQDDCTCEDEHTLKEATDIFRFLHRLTTDADDQRMPTLPALLSPLIPCGNCVENNRRKRKIFPDRDVSEETVIEEESKRAERREDEHWDWDGVPHHAHGGVRHKCPFGFVRIGFMCLSADLL